MRLEGMSAHRGMQDREQKEEAERHMNVEQRKQHKHSAQVQREAKQSF